MSVSSKSVAIPQQHLLPKQDGKTKTIGSKYNHLDPDKMQYIINMRKDLCKDNICSKDGSLNLKYFNVKKGHYWSSKENELLVQGVIEFGVLAFKEIKRKYLESWSETEIRLRICKLLRYYNLKDYQTTKFTDAHQIAEEARKNKKEALRLDQEAKLDKSKNRDRKLVGGILFNPVPLKDLNKEHEGVKASVMSCFFSNKQEKQEMKNE